MTIDDDNNEQEVLFEINSTDFPKFIRHPTFVNYDCADTPSLELILKRRANRKSSPVSSELLKKILEGAAESTLIDVRCITLLKDQGLLGKDD